MTRENRKNNKSNKNQDLEKKRSQEGSRNVLKYRKNRKIASNVHKGYFLNQRL